MTPAPAPLALYARVSTADQDASLQIAALREYAQRRGVPAREFVDEGFSGALSSRPALDAMLVACRRREVAAVVVWKFDRIGRSVSHLAGVLQELEALGIPFTSLTEAVDTGTPAGRMVFHVLGAMAEFERELIRERVTAGLAHAKAQGKQVGRPRLVLDDEELLRLHEAGLSVREIAATITAGGGNVLRHPSPSLVSRELRQLLAGGERG